MIKTILSDRDTFVLPTGCTRSETPKAQPYTGNEHANLLLNSNPNWIEGSPPSKLLWEVLRIPAWTCLLWIPVKWPIIWKAGRGSQIRGALI